MEQNLSFHVNFLNGIQVSMNGKDIMKKEVLTKSLFLTNIVISLYNSNSTVNKHIINKH